ncbi:MAG: hypothetical protein CVU14_03965 [Bacteroidetes bacterium HGW-Bacteroidetes-9]|nr:MAG: hypothetical protein CVU14_03965 [Bacteroidetes bacterium HGW-Bacteroidetes-9]
MHSMNSLARTSCIILSAGFSGRMGQHKALLLYGRGKTTFIEKITKEYSSAGITEIVVVVSSDLMKEIVVKHLDMPDNVRFVVNLYPEWGRFYSLKTGLQNTTKGNYVFFQNIDNPYVDSELLFAMAAVCAQANVVIPQFSGKTGHPVLLSPEVFRAILENMAIDLRIDDFLRSFRTMLIKTENPKVLVNINSSLDYKKEFPG